MCLGCILGVCTFTFTWGSGQLVAWLANRRRERAMRRLEAPAPTA